MPCLSIFRARTVSQLLLEPLADMIASKDLLVVASGVLTSLPLQVLIAAAPPPDTLGATLADGRLVATAGTKPAGDRMARPPPRDHRAAGAPQRTAAPAFALEHGRSPYVGIGNPRRTCG